MASKNPASTVTSDSAMENKDDLDDFRQKWILDINDTALTKTSSTEISSKEDKNKTSASTKNFDPSNFPSRDDIIKDTLPAKSKEMYEDAWSKFVDIMKIPGDSKPTEDDYLRYMWHLRNNLGFKGSSLTSILSRLAAIHCRRFGSSLRTLPAVYKYVDHCRSGEATTKARTFEFDQLLTYLTSPDLQGKYHQVRRAFVLCAYYGGLRGAEMKTLSFSKCKSNPDGVSLTFTRCKQQGELKVNLKKKIYNENIFIKLKFVPYFYRIPPLIYHEKPMKNGATSVLLRILKHICPIC